MYFKCLYISLNISLPLFAHGYVWILFDSLVWTIKFKITKVIIFVLIIDILICFITVFLFFIVDWTMIINRSLTLNILAWFMIKVPTVFIITIFSIIMAICIKITTFNYIIPILIIRTKVFFYFLYWVHIQVILHFKNLIFHL